MATSSKRQAIVDTATRLFTQYGYHAVGIDRIIEEAGVAKMTLFRYFSTKNDLISEVLTQRAHSALGSMASAVATGNTPIERLREVFSWHDRWFNTRDFGGCMFTSALSEFHAQPGEIIRISTKQKVQLRLFIQNLLHDLVPATSIESTARQVVMLIDGATLAAVIGDKTNAANEAWQATECLLHAVQARVAML
ncbi:TetR/AcrR family transcriptional regulator [Burkholderia lata]|uniref:TetR/AcrR family transcriptional regulator n=1 Tax=Burkholderia lata (strain ATCC 17760 / DSM 23089 / LMG 22485 / NCIMB 9086 / R18194 / 383) TaxID=482957 RepID=UPI0015830CAE|nr:TetR/AcrR family transcriptional regulator [Burkholderia lata]